MNDIDIVNEIAQARDRRQSIQRKILAEYPFPLISFSLNIPGPEKNSQLYDKLFFDGMSKIMTQLSLNNFTVAYRCIESGAAGNTGFISVETMPELLKIETVEIEKTHYLGRIFDIDVIDRQGIPFSRKDLGYEPRNCIVCGGNTTVCRRSNRHSTEEILKCIEAIANSYLGNI